MADSRKGPPFRAEIIGSLLRPQPLIQARSRFEFGRLPAVELHLIEDEAIREVVRLQEEIGLEVVTDGEFRRGFYADFLTTAFAGIRFEPGRDDALQFVDATGNREHGPQPIVHDHVRWQPSRAVRDFNFLKGIAKGLPKVTIPGPGYIHFRAGRRHISREVYPNLSAFWSDLVTAYQNELSALADAGCTYVQLDETSLAMLADPKVQQSIEARGDKWEQLLVTYIAAINAIIAGSPSSLTVGVHLCRGNRRNHWVASGGYEPVAEKVFRGLRAPVLFLEYDDARSGGFEPLAKVPDNKHVVLGLVSTRTGAIEPAGRLAERIKEAARFIPLDRLSISPQCGFAADMRGNKITVTQEIAKLRRVVEVARDVWGY